MDRVAAGDSYEIAATWARATYGVDVTVRSVRSATLARRSDVDVGGENRRTVRATLAGDLPSDLDTLDELVRRSRRIARDAQRRGDFKLALRAIEGSRKALHSKLHFAGADQPDAKAEADASPRHAAELVREAFGLVGPRATDVTN